MPTFDYVALDIAGRKNRGVISAESARAARKQVQSRQLTLLELQESSARERRAARGASAGHSTARMNGRERVVITRQLAMLIKASTPIDDALALVAEQAERAALRRGLLAIRNEVSEGARLSEALGRVPGLFDPLYRALVAAGEGSGRLGEVMERLAEHLEKSREMARKVQAALIYPILLLLVASTVVTLLLVFVVPRIVEQFDTLGRELPPITQIVLAVSGFLQGYGWLILLVLLAGAGAFIVGRRMPGIRLGIDGFLLGLPLLGSALRSIDAARFCRTFSTLIGAGTPAYEAMRASSHIIANEATKARLKRAARLVEEGSSVGQALRKTTTFPPMVVHMAAAGERAGELHTMLSRSADYLEGDFEARNQTLLSLLEPAIIIIMGAVVAVIVLSIMLPLLQLNTMAVF